MRKLLILAVIGAAAAMPALAGQPATPARQDAKAQPRGPHTIRGELTLFEMANFAGDRQVVDELARTVRTDWNIRSLSVHPGDRWQICARSGFRDPCIVLDRSVPDANDIGIQGQIGSARPAPAN